MAPFLVVGHLTMKSPGARQKVIDALTKAMHFAQESEPGVTKYCITIPKDDADQNTVFAIEEYASKAASDSHMTTSAVQDLISLLSTNPDILESPPKVYTLDQAFGFTRPETANHENPFILFATLAFQSGTREKALAAWSNSPPATEAQEPGVLSYRWYTSAEEPEKLFSVEAYESEDYLWSHHAKAPHVVKAMETVKDIGTDTVLVALKRVTGYMYKDSGSAIRPSL
ncbi:hypothetical protein K402DRAFT_392323 [Aulographum hederae CBS 113979]|uniref:ABM domain-containing protein n=1 Tax=Aulographum hederae CBS 113979 TaxID=1176131 RepID=A0A6G1H4V2_9PEZI|nr:hypothetical protein K402DRAFT_392323 [Aulographum hederae CBS 113979]